MGVRGARQENIVVRYYCRLALPPVLDTQFPKIPPSRITMSEAMFNSLNSMLFTAANLSAIVRQEHARPESENVEGYLDGLDRILSMAIQVGVIIPVLVEHTDNWELRETDPYRITRAS